MNLYKTLSVDIQTISEKALLEEIKCYCEIKVEATNQGRVFISLYELGTEITRESDVLYKTDRKRLSEALTESLEWITNHQEKLDEMALDRLLFGTYSIAV